MYVQQRSTRSRKKAPKYQDAPPKVSDLNEAKVLIDELWEQLRHYEDKLTTSSKKLFKIALIRQS
ncbi:DUF6444 domain-containing protein [Vibrio cincinnatiensis]|uniref:DUF6444 domain-containing protein n=1 Tax=Vibrio cincinnatiensis TaxID=675 RepID=UPI003B9793E3